MNSLWQFFCDKSKLYYNQNNVNEPFNFIPKRKDNVISNGYGCDIQD